MEKFRAAFTVFGTFGVLFFLAIQSISDRTDMGKKGAENLSHRMIEPSSSIISQKLDEVAQHFSKFYSKYSPTKSKMAVEEISPVTGRALVKSRTPKVIPEMAEVTPDEQEPAPAISHDSQDSQDFRDSRDSTKSFRKKPVIEKQKRMTSPMRTRVGQHAVPEKNIHGSKHTKNPKVVSQHGLPYAKRPIVGLLHKPVFDPKNALSRESKEVLSGLLGVKKVLKSPDYQAIEKNRLRSEEDFYTDDSLLNAKELAELKTDGDTEITEGFYKDEDDSKTSDEE